MIRVLVALALLAAGLQLTGLSTAAFTAESPEAPSTFTGGTLELTVDQAAGTALDGQGMRPGVTRTGIVALKNSGTVPTTVSAAIRDVADVPAAAGLSAVLALKIEDCGVGAGCEAPTTAYDGSVRDFSGAPVGVVPAGATRRVRVSLTWGSAKDDPARQGARTDATLVWNAVSGASK